MIDLNGIEGKLCPKEDGEITIGVTNVHVYMSTICPDEDIDIRVDRETLLFTAETRPLRSSRSIIPFDDVIKPERAYCFS